MFMFGKFTDAMVSEYQDVKRVLNGNDEVLKNLILPTMRSSYQVVALG